MKKTDTLLCESFIELLKKHPFQKITIQMISTKSGVNRQTFYYHYDNVYDLMEHAFEYEFIEKSGLSANMYSWDNCIEQLLIWMKNNRVIIRNLISNVDGRYLRAAIYPILNKCMSNKYQPNVIVKNIGDEMEEEFIHKFLTIAITQYILEWAENEFKEPVDEVVNHILLVLRRMYGEKA